VENAVENFLNPVDELWIKSYQQVFNNLLTSN